MTKQLANRLTDELTKRFAGTPALAAAVNELNTCSDYAEYFTAIVGEAADVYQTLLDHCIRRGNIWS